jgi:hypothetical protein
VPLHVLTSIERPIVRRARDARCALGLGYPAHRHCIGLRQRRTESAMRSADQDPARGIHHHRLHAAPERPCSHAEQSLSRSAGSVTP